jgi:hypothetical protein
MFSPTLPASHVMSSDIRAVEYKILKDWGHDLIEQASQDAQSWKAYAPAPTKGSLMQTFTSPARERSLKRAVVVMAK